MIDDKVERPEDEVLVAKDSVPMTAEQIRIAVEETTARINEHWTDAQQNILAIGKCLIKDVFGGSARSALDPAKAHKNKVYARLLARAGTLTLLPNRAALSLALRLGAYDKLANASFYNLLDVGRRIELLRLPDARSMQEGAQHAIEKNVNRKNLRRWVELKLKKDGRRVRTRAPTLSSFASSVEQMHKRFVPSAHLERFAELASGLPPDKRAELRERMKETLAALQAALKTIR